MFHPFIICGQQVGFIRPEILKELLNFPEVFFVHDVPKNSELEFEVNLTGFKVFKFNRFLSPQTIVELNPAYRNYSERSEKVDEMLREMRAKGLFPEALLGWRDECYEVLNQNNVSMMKMDRSATCLFGIRNFGVEINGFIRCPDRGMCIWLQQRSATKQTWPSKWDNMVSGGLAVGFGIRETAIKEAAEEASIPESLAQKIVSAGCVSFFFESERGELVSVFS